MTGSETLLLPLIHRSITIIMKHAINTNLVRPKLDAYLTLTPRMSNSFFSVTLRAPSNTLSTGYAVSTSLCAILSPLRGLHVKWLIWYKNPFQSVLNIFCFGQFPSFYGWNSKSILKRVMKIEYLFQICRQLWKFGLKKCTEADAHCHFFLPISYITASLTF